MKSILITGATAGVGEAAARKFVGGGWRAIGTGRRGDRLKRLQQELGDAFLPLEIDMLDRAAVESLAQLEEPRGEVDLLLNNAGLAPPTDPLPETDWDRIEQVIDTNVTGLVALTRALMP
jgi:serine 3-dehydrogenase